MENEMQDMTKPTDARGFVAVVRRFFHWRHLLIVGATVCLALSLLCYLYISASRLLVAGVLFPLSLLLMAWMLIKERLYRYPDMKLLLAAFVWLSAVCLLNADRAGAANFLPYANACAIAFLCWPLAYALRPERRKKTLDLLASIWIIPIVCSAVLGIVLVSTDTVLYRQSDMALLGMYMGRLMLICDSNMYGILCCMGICLTMYLLMSRRRPLVMVLLILAGLCQYTALALTGNRTSQLALLFAAFFFAALLVRRHFINVNRILRLLASVLAGMIFCAALWLGYRGAVVGVNWMMEKTEKVQSASEPAPEEAVQAVPGEGGTAVTRPLDNTQTLEIRLGIWRYALERLSEEGDVLLRGASPALAPEMFLDTSGYYVYNHFHNAYFGVLLAYGIPGVILMLVFLVGLAVCACRLLFSNRSELPDALRFLPVLLLPILAINMLEEMLFTRSFVSELDVWLAILGGYTAVLSREWRSEKHLPNT